jgi:rhamnosyltransferase
MVDTLDPPADPQLGTTAARDRAESAGDASHIEQPIGRIACIVHTHNGRDVLACLLESLEGQTAKFDVLIVDSGSSDGTVELARECIPGVTVLPAAEFNHHGMRLLADQYPPYDLYVYLAQDAWLANRFSLERIIEPFSDPTVGAVCGRQLPHFDASPLAAHFQLFNFRAGVQVRTMGDVPKLGIKAALMSNDFAAYRREALAAVGGFPEAAITAEDVCAAAKMLLAGWKIVYAGNAECRHSHNYSLPEEFRRYFDIGVFHAREPWIRGTFGSAGGEGLRYMKSELRFLGLRRLRLWPASILRMAIRAMGYKLGQQDARLPIALKRKLSMHRRYWDGPFAVRRASDVSGS